MSVKELSFKEGIIAGVCLGAFGAVLLVIFGGALLEIGKARIDQYCNDKTNVNPLNLRGNQNER